MSNKPFERGADMDAAIDRAVRDIMGAEARADMRQRVMARIAGRPARAWTLPRLAMASAAVAALIAIAFVWSARSIHEPPSSLALNPGHDQVRTPGSAPSVPAPTAQPRPATGPREPVRLVASKTDDIVERGIPRGQVVAQSVEAGVSSFDEVTPLDPLSPLTVNALHTPAPAIPDIALGTILVKDLRVEPLGAGQ